MCVHRLRTGAEAEFTPTVVPPSASVAATPNRQRLTVRSYRRRKAEECAPISDTAVRYVLVSATCTQAETVNDWSVYSAGTVVRSAPVPPALGTAAEPGLPNRSGPHSTHLDGTASCRPVSSVPSPSRLHEPASVPASAAISSGSTNRFHTVTSEIWPGK